MDTKPNMLRSNAKMVKTMSDSDHRRTAKIVVQSTSGEREWEKTEIDSIYNALDNMMNFSPNQQQTLKNPNFPENMK